MNDPITHPRYRNAAVTLHLGDNLGVSLALPDASVDAIVTVEAADRLARIGGTLQGRLRKAGLAAPTIRLNEPPGRPSACRLADIRKALS